MKPLQNKLVKRFEIVTSPVLFALIPVFFKQDVKPVSFKTYYFEWLYWSFMLRVQK